MRVTFGLPINTTLLQLPALILLNRFQNQVTSHHNYTVSLIRKILVESIPSVLITVSWKIWDLEVRMLLTVYTVHSQQHILTQLSSATLV
jgi:hypothetical protein